LLNFFYTDRILGQAGRKIGESVGSISRGPTPGTMYSMYDTWSQEEMVVNVQCQHVRM
jgi:hypothetical protein